MTTQRNDQPEELRAKDECRSNMLDDAMSILETFPRLAKRYAKATVEEFEERAPADLQERFYQGARKVFSELRSFAEKEAEEADKALERLGRRRAQQTAKEAAAAGEASPEEKAESSPKMYADKGKG